MNENFINTWVPNSELGRVPSLLEPIAKRREREGKTFDTSHALAQAIMKGWKKGSPADSLVISPAFEVMGRLPVNERYRQEPVQEYLTFLKDSLAGALPGFGEGTSQTQSIDWKVALESDHVASNTLKVVLTDAAPEQEILSTFRTPELGYQDYTVIEIDATAFKNGGRLTIALRVGDAGAAGSFDLYPGDGELPTKGMPEGALTSAWDIPPNENGIIEHYFAGGQVFKLGATGNWFSEKGSVNAFMAKISVEPGQKPELREAPSTHAYQSPEDLMNAFVKAFKNLDTAAIRSMLTGRAIEIFGIENMPEDVPPQLSRMLSQMEVLDSRYVGDEFHFRLRVPAASSPEMSFKVAQTVGGIWLIYDVKPSKGD